jgi:small subunit ribosomal protein S4
MCRAEGTRLFLKGERCRSAKCPITKKKAAPGKGLRARTKKQSDYAMQLREKQRLKRMYGMLEAQFHLFFERATQAKGVTGEVLIQSLERRMDNVVYRMHFAPSRKAARQLVLHGHVRLNGRTASVPSQLVKANDVVSISERSAKLTGVMESLKEYSRSGIVPWLEVDPDKMTGTVKAIPRRSEVTDLADIREQLIVELYSK